MPKTVNNIDEAKEVLRKWLLEQGYKTVTFSTSSGPFKFDGKEAYSITVVDDWYGDFFVTDDGRIIDRTNYVKRLQLSGLIQAKTK